MKQSFKILTEKMLDRELGHYSKKVRSNSGSTPLAPITILRSIKGLEFTQEDIFTSTKSLIKKRSPLLYYLILFMEASACRVNEALRITPVFITSTGHVKIKASKGSKDRVVSSGMATDFMRECKRKGVTPWQDWSRHFVYRELKKYGIGQYFNQNKKKSVTHIFRHELARSIEKAGMNITDSKSALGHKSIKSTSYYHGNKS